MINDPITVFENIKRINEYKSEYWSARKLAKTLKYKDYRNFELVIKKAKKSCKNSNQPIKDHFVDTTEMIKLGKTATRSISDIYLSRYACYLVMQNADPTKTIVALGQTYFAIQARKQEVQATTNTWPKQPVEQVFKTLVDLPITGTWDYMVEKQ